MAFFFFFSLRWLVFRVDRAARRPWGREGQGDPPGSAGGCGLRSCRFAGRWRTGRPSDPSASAAKPPPGSSSEPSSGEKEVREGRSAWGGPCSSAGEAAEALTAPTSFPMSWEGSPKPRYALYPDEGLRSVMSARIGASRTGGRRCWWGESERAGLCAVRREVI